MRITAEAKSATRQRILEVATELFRTRGFDETTTRDIAREAEIATGTLFNYFATKEAIVTELVSQSLARARSDFERATGAETLEESLFAFVAAELRQMRPVRKYLRPLLDGTFCPMASRDRSFAGDTLRVQHLEVVAELARHHGVGELSPIALQLYWTLYTGVLAFWSADKSPKQEDTLALLDESLAMFVAWQRASDTEQ